MQAQSDAQLLREFAERGHEAAFREIVTRHTDFVYSTALRQVESPDLARDIAQSVFVDLARKAKPVGDRLSADASLVGWLYRSTRFAALTHLRDDRRRAAHERLAMEQLLTNSEAAPDWERIRPVLDEAMDNLSDDDRDALLLRYFKNHDLRAVGLALGVSDDAAQKRVSRAVERLREFFAKRGVSVGASGLVVAISANAVQVAPIGLAVTISTAATLAGANIAATATATATKAIAMTTLQKSLIAAILAAAVGTGIYEAHQVSALQTQLQTSDQQQTQLAGQLEQLNREHDDATRQLAAHRNENARLNGATAELLKLRGEVTRLRAEARELAQSKNNTQSDVTEAVLKSWLGRVKELKRLPERMPDKTIPELQLLTDEDWLELAKEPLDHAAKEVNLEDDATARLVFRAVRAKAKDKLMRVLSRALAGYADAHSGQLPTDTLQLKPFIMNSHFLGPARAVEIPEAAVDETVLRRYEILQTGKMEDVPGDRTILAEKAPVDTQYDTRLRVGRAWMGVSELEAYSPEKGARME